MREIKFRGKGKDTGDWVYGDLRHQKVGDFYEIDGWTVNTDTIGQFTGLYDKNGKEIYEGDIVKYKTAHRFEVKQPIEEAENFSENINAIRYEDYSFYPMPCRYDEEDDYYSWGRYDFEVIGNIYDNPELIKE